MKIVSITIFLAALFIGSKNPVLPNHANASLADTIVHYEGEKHFKNIRQLTFGGDNAEAYFSYDGKYVIYQRTDPANGIHCDQI